MTREEAVAAAIKYAMKAARAVEPNSSNEYACREASAASNISLAYSALAPLLLTKAEIEAGSQEADAQRVARRERDIAATKHRLAPETYRAYLSARSAGDQRDLIDWIEEYQRTRPVDWLRY